MRCGLVLIVCVPSGVSFYSMMYVGMALPSSRSVAVAAAWFLSHRTARCTLLDHLVRIEAAARLFRKR